MKRMSSRRTHDRAAALAGIALCVACVPLALLGGSPPARASIATASTATPSTATATASTAGTAEHWGTFFGDGTPGDGDTSLSPVAVTLPGPVAEIGTSNSTEYALLANGEVYAWGEGAGGQLGDGRSQNSFTTPVRVQFPAGVKIASIPADTMPFDSALAIDTHGHAWGWGLNLGGEFCLGNSRAYRTPVRLPFTGVTLLAGADDHATYDAGGTLYACGLNQYGELGDGGRAASRVPVRVRDLAGAQVTALTASFANSGALLRDGKYYDWGFDGEGELGNGTTRQAAVAPVRVKLPGAVAQAVEGGSLATNGQTLVLLADGALFAWGDDDFGQLGTRTAGQQPSPVRFYPPAGVTYKFLATGGSTSYAISAAGAVYAWGASGVGQTGDGSKTTASTPVLVTSGATRISSTAEDVAVSIR